MSSSKGNKTVATQASVEDYIAAIADPERRADCERLLKMMGELSGEDAKMWGPSIVGFGTYHYRYKSGREGDFLRTGFSSRARDITVYVIPGYEALGEELSRLGNHKLGKSCLYIKRLSDVDDAVLTEIIAKGLAIMDERYPRER